MNRPIPWMLWWAVATHIVWSCILPFNESVRSIAVLVGLKRMIDLFDEQGIVTAVVVGSAALLAAYALITEHRHSARYGFILLLPQYTIVLISFLSAVDVVVQGRIEGRDLDRALIFAAETPIFFASLFHTTSIIERYVVPWKLGSLSLR